MAVEFQNVGEFNPEVLNSSLRTTYDRLAKGISDRGDTITWRSMILSMTEVLGSENPEWSVPNCSIEEAAILLRHLTHDTHLYNLAPEILYAVGFTNHEFPEQQRLDALIVNSRHGPEELLWDVADDFAERAGKQIAVMNPIGHYNDRHSRILGPERLFHDVEKAVFFTSTQEQYGGRFGTLYDSLDLLRNPEFSSHVKEVAVVVPMWGGSRSHKSGQRKEVGYEVFQARTTPGRMCSLVRDIQRGLRRKGVVPPNFKFYSVDIHNNELPGEVFKKHGFEFHSISPMGLFANELEEQIEKRGLKGTLPVRFVAVDKGARARNYELAEQFLQLGANGHNWVEVIEIDKKRNRAGEVESAKIIKAVRMTKNESGEIEKEEIELANLDHKMAFIRVTTDDMIDTGKSAKVDDERLDDLLPNAEFKITVATHPIFSQGIDRAIENTGAQVVVVGNTLTNPDLYKDKRLKVVNLASAVVEAIL